MSSFLSIYISVNELTIASSNSFLLFNFIFYLSLAILYTHVCLLFTQILIKSFFADRVFGPATTTRHVYDVAAQHVVSGSMEGINGN